MQYNLFDFFSEFKDARRSQGQRHKFEVVLSIVVMAILSGCSALKEFARFAKSNEAELIDCFQLKHGVPTFGTFRNILNSLDEQAFAVSFMNWIKQYHPNLPDNGVAMDGKVLRSTLKNVNAKTQNFVSVVSAFGHQSGLIYGMQAFANGKSGEAAALRSLIEQLGLTGVVITADALHTQKKL